MAQCPKCGAERQPGATECMQCGIIFARFEQLAAKKQRKQEEEIRAERIAEINRAAEAKAAAIEREERRATGPKLINCSACKKQISVNAKTCPHCGEPITDTYRDAVIETQKIPIGWIVSTFIIIGFAVFLLATKSYMERETTKHEKSVRLYEDNIGWHTLPSDTFGCRNLESYQKVARLATSGDKQAYETMFIAGIASGECKILDGGARVYLESYKMMAGAAQIRVQGETTTWWVSSNSLK